MSNSLWYADDQIAWKMCFPFALQPCNHVLQEERLTSLRHNLLLDIPRKTGSLSHGTYSVDNSQTPPQAEYCFLSFSIAFSGGTAKQQMT